MAFRYGAAALDAVLCGERTELAPAEITSQEILAREIQRVITDHTALAFYRDSGSPKVAQLLVQSAVQPARSNGDGDSEANQDMQEGIMAMLQALPWTRDAAKAHELGLIHPLEKDGVGMRANELLLAAAGQLPPETAQIMASAKYPAPPKSTAVTVEAMTQKLSKK